MNRINLRIYCILTVILVVALLTGCSANQDSSVEPDTDIKQLVADYSTGQLKAINASINASQLIVTMDEQKQYTYDLPDDEFFVSIAPYLDVTHPCAIHSLTGCQGEMVNEQMEVYITDQAGNVIRNEMMKTQDNGFIDLWLPRDSTYQVTITHANGVARQEIATFENDQTCITTMQLIES